MGFSTKQTNSTESWIWWYSFLLSFLQNFSYFLLFSSFWLLLSVFSFSFCSNIENLHFTYCVLKVFPRDELQFIFKTWEEKLYSFFITFFYGTDHFLSSGFSDFRVTCCRSYRLDGSKMQNPSTGACKIHPFSISMYHFCTFHSNKIWDKWEHKLN